jgi:hypothetical protein
MTDPPSALADFLLWDDGLLDMGIWLRGGVGGPYSENKIDRLKHAKYPSGFESATGTLP